MTASQLTVSTGSATDAQSRLALDALRSQRRRLVDLFSAFDDDAWTAPTRCAEWSVHEVVRHLCDVTVRWHALLRGEPPETVGTAALDPRTTPVVWLEGSAGESPVDTIGVFDRASADLLEDVAELATRNAIDRCLLPYGAVPWSALMLHLFWDAWVHERDILLPLDRTHASPTIESRAAATYALVMAAVPFLLLGTPFEETVVLDGDGGGSFQIHVRDGAVTVRMGEADDTPDPLRGALPIVVDSLIGRGPQPSQVLRGPAERAEALGKLRRFVLTPVA